MIDKLYNNNQIYLKKIYIIYKERQRERQKSNKIVNICNFAIENNKIDYEGMEK